MKSVKERRWPYLITAIFYLFTFFLLKEARLPDLIYRLQAGGILTVCMTALISLRWKISAHMAGIGGICALFMLSPIGTGSDGTLIATALILLSGLIGSSRIYLKAHHAAQVFAGWLLGFSSVSIFL
jgi:membrane-associated phospholipid phosphatase